MLYDAANVRVWTNITVAEIFYDPSSGSSRYGISVVDLGNNGPINFIDHNLNWSVFTNLPLGIYYLNDNLVPSQFGQDNRFGDPLFTNVPFDVHVKPGSPALGFTNLANYMYAHKDIEFVTRPPSSVTVGAYQTPHD